MIDYDTMEAGRELDALVAELVMGWRWINYVPPVEGANRVTFLTAPGGFDHGRAKSDEWPEWRFGKDGRVIHENYQPHYSTEIKDAWRVVTAAKAWPRDLSTIFISYLLDIIGNRTWDESKFRWAGLNAILEMRPDDICRAALMAKDFYERVQLPANRRWNKSAASQGAG